MAIPSGNPQHPLRGTGDYTPPPFVDPQPLLHTGQQVPSLSGVPVWPSVAAEHYAGLHQRAAGRETGNAFLDLVDILRQIYPPTGGAKGEIGPIGEIIRNNQPVADRQTLTMNAVRPSGDPQHPLPGTGRYQPPQTVSPNSPQRPYDQYDVAAMQMAPSGIEHLLAGLLHLYPGGRPWGVSGEGAQTIQNSQAIGDRSPTTMTNPLPNYTPPAMVNTPLAQQLRAMVNHALAQRGLSPLINAPLPVGPTQMGMAR